MKNAEMQVLRFDAGDVIATSGICVNNAANHIYVNAVGEETVNATWYYYDGGIFAGDVPDVYPKTIFYDSANINTGWYYMADGHFYACESGDKHPTN